jgi:altronate dehydratase
MVNVLRINVLDNVVTALRELPVGTLLVADDPLPAIATSELIPFGHKVAISTIRAGDMVIKYGASIGKATAEIAAGQHVHVHNLKSVRGAVQHAK